MPITPGEPLTPAAIANQDFTDITADSVTITPTQSAAAIPIQLDLGWAIYVDNVNIAGAAGTRMWIDCAANADMVVGPRSGANLISTLRLRTNRTTASAANMFIDSTNYTISRSTSSRKYKTEIQEADLDLDAVRQLRPVRFKDRGEVAELGVEAAPWHVGFIAEEVDELGLREYVQYDTETGAPDGLQYDRIVTGLLGLVQDQDARIDELQRLLLDQAARLSTLEASR